MDAALKAIADYGIAVVAMVVLALFAWWLLRRYLDDLTKTRDQALEGWRGSTTAIDRLTDELQKRRERS